jgi:ketosteroid isomerase-like protein
MTSSPVVESTQAQIVQSFLDALARHDVEAAMAAVDPRVTVTVHPLGIRGTGPGVLNDVITDLVRAFPDLMISVSRVIATGDVVTALFKAEGTQAASYAGAINQEKHLDIDQAWRFTVANGLITEISAYWCQAQLYRRLAVKRYDEIAIA